MDMVGQGSIVIWQGASLWVLQSAGPASAAILPHAHHAIQLTFSLAGSFEIEAEGRIWSDPVVAVRSDARHIFRGQGAVAFLFVEPESAIGRALADRLFEGMSVAAWEGGDAAAALAALRQCHAAGADEADLLEIGRAIVAGLDGAPGRLLPDIRVARMIAFAADQLEQGVGLASAAAHVGLSPGRARHLFVAETGLAFKSYLLWLRLERAVQLYARGASLTDAAHLAGFADSAHLSRTFRRTFGLPAAALRLGRPISTRSAPASTASDPHR